MAHSWIIRFLEHRIADKRILRLIAKWLKVGTVEDGRRTRGVCGAPQGAVISPILANVYLHYAFDLWVHRWRLTKASGDMIVIRYADDTIVGFQHEHEAQAFLDDLKERMRKFELALHPDKTRLIRFGRHAAKQREKRGEGKPETFDFLVQGTFPKLGGGPVELGLRGVLDRAYETVDRLALCLCDVGERLARAQLARQSAPAQPEVLRRGPEPS